MLYALLIYEKPADFAQRDPSVETGSYVGAWRRYYQAMIEAGNGEFDDCLDMTARATDEIKERRHTLQPGEKLKVLQSNE